jgi:AAA+ ATPase superfamily predicted ATPase
MVKFTDRKEELESLRQRFENLRQGELIILYGRRRVGKTELVRKFLADNVAAAEGAYILVDERAPADMLRSISEDVSISWPEVRADFKSWESFFSFLGERARERKTVVVIDEFQRMHADPRAFTRFQKLWDTKLKDAPIMVVFLGSAVGAIQRIAISSKSPLFGRATARIKLRPFGYQSFRQALAGIDEEMLMKLYATFGGMPSYLSFAEQCTEASKYMGVVEAAMLRKDGLLRDEPQALLRMELKDTGRYNSILAAIAGGHRNPKEISDQTGIGAGQIGFYLNKLERYLELIKKVTPLCGKHRPQYVFQDNFFAFWYNFVFRNLSALEIENYGYVKERIGAEMPAFEGRIFESVVRELLAKWNGKKLGDYALDFSELGSWWGRKEGDVDIVGLGKKSMLVGEVKWENAPVDAQVVAELENRISFLSCTPEQRSNVRMLVVAKAGFTPSAKRYMEEKNVVGLELKDVARMFDSLPQK